MAVADALTALDPQVRITALGTARGLETRLVPERGYHLELITPVPLPRKPSGDLARLPPRVWRAVRETRAVLDDVDADVVIGFGGYVALPAYLAARGLVRRSAPAHPGGDPRGQCPGGAGQPGRRPLGRPGALRGAGFGSAPRRGGRSAGAGDDHRAGPRRVARRSARALRLRRRCARAAGIRRFPRRGLAQPGGIGGRRRPGRRRCVRPARARPQEHSRAAHTRPRRSAVRGGALPRPDGPGLLRRRHGDLPIRGDDGGRGIGRRPAGHLRAAADRQR